MKNSAKILSIILVSVSQLAMSQELKKADPDLRDYVVSIDGSSEPHKLSKGRAIFGLIKQTTSDNTNLSGGDASIFLAEAGEVARFAAYIRKFQLSNLDRLAKDHLEGKRQDEIDAVAVAEELHRLDDMVWAEYDKKYLPVVESLSPAGQALVNDEAVPAALASSKRSFLDYRLLAADHPDYVRKLFFEAWASVSERGGIFGREVERHTTEHVSESGVVAIGITEIW